MSRLFIIRHAIAEDRDVFKQTGLPDDERPLTSEGRKKFQKVAAQFHRKEPKIDHFIQSPLLRSQQTLDILKKYYKKATFSTSPHLQPGAPFDALATDLKTYKKKTIAIIGHEDHLSHFTCYLLTGQRQGAFLRFKKGGIAALDFHNEVKVGDGHLAWLITPKVI